jgi:hypothetical protein
MIFIPPINELAVPYVVQPGVGNLERVVFRPNEHTNLARYCLGIVRNVGDGSLSLVNDWLFTFPSREIAPPAWVIVFTGVGDFRSEPILEGNVPVHVFFWNHKQTLFGSENISPLLFQIGAMHPSNKVPSGIKPGETIKAISPSK